MYLITTDDWKHAVEIMDSCVQDRLPFCIIGERMKSYRIEWESFVDETGDNDVKDTK